MAFLVSISSNIFSISDNGTKVLTKKVPSAITSWMITSFSVNPAIGLGLTKQASKLKVFQPFFVSTNLPYSIKRGEIVAIPVTVFNYLENDLPVDVTLHNENGEFEFVEIDERENNVRRKRSAGDSREKRVFAKTNDGATTSFMIRPLKVGHVTIKVVATSAIAGDGVERLLLVEPEGVTKYMNKVLLIDLKSSDAMQTKAEIVIPSNAVPDSTKIEIGAVGDVMGPSIDNLEKLM
jgi:CD109 antigen